MRSRPIRGLLLSLLISLLLIAQQSAFVHGLEHLPGSASSSSELSPDKRGAPADQYCEKCLAFAQIGAAAHQLPALVPILAIPFEAIGFCLPVAVLARLGTPRSRGPPLLP